MRRSTQSAILFGELIYQLRTCNGFTMRQVASKLGVHAATISQVEKAQRALKESKLSAWASALEVDESFLRERWLYFQKEHPDQPIKRKRNRTSTTKQLLAIEDQLTGPERERVIGYMHRLIEERKEDNDD